MFNKNEIDVLINKQCRLIVKKQRLQDNTKAKLSAIENKIDKLTSDAFVKRQEMEYKTKEFDREIKKLAGQIQLERSYASDGTPVVEADNYDKAEKQKTPQYRVK